MGIFDFLGGLLSQNGNNKGDSANNESIDDDSEYNEDEYLSYEDCLEEDDPEQYHTYIELATGWEEMNEDEWEKRYNSLDDEFKELVDESISEQTEYE